MADALPYREQGLVPLQAGHLDRAVDLPACAVEADDRDAAVQGLLGVVSSQKRLHAQAHHALQIATALDPRNAGIRFNLGLVLTHAGNREGAIQAFLRTLEPQADCGGAQERLRVLGCHFPLPVEPDLPARHTSFEFSLPGTAVARAFRHAAGCVRYPRILGGRPVCFEIAHHGLDDSPGNAFPVSRLPGGGYTVTVPGRFPAPPSSFPLETPSCSFPSARVGRAFASSPCSRWLCWVGPGLSSSLSGRVL